MILEKAIEILKELNIDQWSALPPEKQDAVNLGIEALKVLDGMLLMFRVGPFALLPGETMDIKEEK